ncbi:hypothetical protein BDW62DRAFT_205661 [Aspergillus aurantiobrunneus]
MRPRMCFDDVAWERSESISEAWIKDLFKTDNLRAIGGAIAAYRKGSPIDLCEPRGGAFNALFRMNFQQGNPILIRLTNPGMTMFPDEKTRYEVAAIAYLRHKTSIPLPLVLHWGTKEESPLRGSPFDRSAFRMMEYIENAMTMNEPLNKPSLKIEDRPLLDPYIDVGKLEMLYGQLADVLLQLSRATLPQIGSITQEDDRTWESSSRHLTFVMNQLVSLGTLPRPKLPATSFNSASSYFEALANLNIEHLEHQRNDAVELEADCRRKFVARRLFLKLAREKRLTSAATDSGPFPIWCDDFLTRKHTAIAQGRLEESERLSGPMQRGWESGDFWVVYAARKSFAFDSIFWKKVEPRYFGPSELSEEDRWTERLELLDEEEKKAMEVLVKRKLGDMKRRVLAWETDES